MIVSDLSITISPPVNNIGMLLVSVPLKEIVSPAEAEEIVALNEPMILSEVVFTSKFAAFPVWVEKASKVKVRIIIQL